MTVAPGSAEPPRAVPLARDRALAVVTTRPGAVLRGIPGARQLSEVDTAELEGGRLERGAVIVGDTEEWQSRWGALAAARRSAEVVLDACSPADLRALTRSRELPPLLAGVAGAAWRLEPDGSVSRVEFAP